MSESTNPPRPTPESITRLSQCRPDVQRFALLMEQVLRRNDHKGGWKEMLPNELIQRMRDELDEVDTEYTYYEIGNFSMERFAISTALEAADVANFAMFLADNLGQLPEVELA